MSSENPYQPPTTDIEVVTQASDEDVWAFVEPQSVPMGRGLTWLGEGFRFFWKNPGAWIAITIVYFLIMMFSSFVPFATYILQPILAGGLMLGLYAQDRGGAFEFNHLFEGFSNQTDKLAVFGAVLLGIAIALSIVFAILFFVGIVAAFASHEANSSNLFVLIIILIATPITIIVFMLYGALIWFGPPLIVLHKLSVADAFKMSLLALKRNIGAFIIFTIVATILMFLSIFTLYLALFIIWPMLFGATYASWKDIFTQAPTH